MTDGLELLRMEMARQRADALASFHEAAGLAARIAERIRATGRLVLYGMGGSHYVNRAAEILYREAGIDATAMVMSEVLSAPLPADRPRVAILVSQSGRSGEIVQYLGSDPGAEERFGLTLDGDSTLARTCPSLLGVGGVEKAFAATRSITITIALHAALLAALGQSQDAVVAALGRSDAVALDAAEAQLAGREAVLFVGRHALQGIADGGALALMELARMTALSLEGGQFRHGPLEALGPRLGLVFLRSAGPDRDAISPLAETAARAGAGVVLLDAGGEGGDREAVLRVPVATGVGLGAALDILFPMQRLIIALAAARVDNPGVPVRSSKVTV